MFRGRVEGELMRWPKHVTKVPPYVINGRIGGENYTKLKENYVAGHHLIDNFLIIQMYDNEILFFQLKNYSYRIIFSVMYK